MKTGEKIPSFTKEAIPESIVVIESRKAEGKWALVVNEAVAYLTRTSGDIAISQCDSNSVMEAKEVADLVSQTFRGIAKSEGPKPGMRGEVLSAAEALEKDDLYVAKEAEKTSEKLSECLYSLWQIASAEVNDMFAETINAYNSKEEFGFSVNALSLRLVRMCGDLSEGQPVQRIEWMIKASESISVSFNSIDETGKALSEDNHQTADKIDKEVARMKLLVKRN